MKLSQLILNAFIVISFVLSVQTSAVVSKRKKNYHISNIKLKRFARPLCMIGNGKQGQSFKKKLKIMKRYQRKISRKTRDFKKNRKKETKAVLHGSPKWIVIKNLRAKGYTWEEIDFAFFTLTLFAEARNLNREDMSMVARVINNRKGKKTYRDTVTKLAQFSSWYYKNQRDNVVMLCPGKAYNKVWSKTVNVAKSFFYKEDKLFKSTHYFAPRNMVPRYRVPRWAKGNYALGYGGHIFLVKKKNINQAMKKRIVYLNRKIGRVKVVRGKITILD